MRYFKFFLVFLLAVALMPPVCANATSTAKASINVSLAFPTPTALSGTISSFFEAYDSINGTSTDIASAQAEGQFTAPVFAKVDSQANLAILKTIEGEIEATAKSGAEVQNFYAYGGGSLSVTYNAILYGITDEPDRFSEFQASVNAYLEIYDNPMMIGGPVYSKTIVENQLVQANSGNTNAEGGFLSLDLMRGGLTPGSPYWVKLVAETEITATYAGVESSDVPEPSTILLMGLGLGIIWARKNIKKS